MLVIMRGLPGSGKSFLAKKMAETYTYESKAIFSTDNYFMVNGKYIFNPDLLGIFHKKNLKAVSEYLKATVPGYATAIVDNTNTTWKEIKPYCQVARETNHSICFVEPDTPWKYDLDELVKRNSHGVPRESIARMLERFASSEHIKSLFRKEYGYEPTYFNGKD